ncbi:alkA N-terminal domain protein [Mycobacterium xenopi 3993]|nr:alkA N-terminal domain protein [Mycobacterium xenopi 3993]
MRGDVVARAMRLIGDGTVDREGVAGLAGGWVHHTPTEEAAAGRSRCWPTRFGPCPANADPRILIKTTALALSDVAFAAGFSSIRQFNDTIHSVCGTTPTAVRNRAAARFTSKTGFAGSVSLRLAVRTPFAYEGILGHLATTAVPGCEEVHDGAYRRTLRLPNGNGLVSLTRPRPCPLPAAGRRPPRLGNRDRPLPPAVGPRCGPRSGNRSAGAGSQFGPLVAKAPGQRIPRTIDEAELAVRVVLGQQVSTHAARTHAARLVAAYGQPIHDAHGSLTHLFPSVDRLGEIDSAHLAVPRARPTEPGRTRCWAQGRQRGLGRWHCDWERPRRQLLALPGIGPGARK